MHNFEWCCVWVLSPESLRVSYPFDYTTYMVGMARLELARDFSQRILSPLRLPISPHPYARHARSVPDTPCTYWLRAKVLLVQLGTRAILLGHGWRNCTIYRLSLPMKNSENSPPASLQLKSFQIRWRDSNPFDGMFSRFLPSLLTASGSCCSYLT